MREIASKDSLFDIFGTFRGRQHHVVWTQSSPFSPSYATGKLFPHGEEGRKAAEEEARRKNMEFAGREEVSTSQGGYEVGSLRTGETYHAAEGSTLRPYTHGVDDNTVHETLDEDASIGIANHPIWDYLTAGARLWEKGVGTPRSLSITIDENGNPHIEYKQRF